VRSEAVDTLFGEWAERFRRGERPDPREYLRRSGAARDELAALIDAFLVAAPRPEPDPEVVDLTAAWLRGESPLVVLRTRRGVTRDAALDAISAEFGLSAAQRPALRARFHELEAGLLDPSGLSDKLVTLLARLLATTGDVVRGWRPRQLRAAPAYRASESAPIVMSRRIPEYDEQVDRLFLSSRKPGKS
jgi:hypothetical protein